MRVIVDIEEPLYGTMEYFKKHVVPALNIRRELKGESKMTEQEEIDYYLDRYNECTRTNSRNR